MESLKHFKLDTGTFLPKIFKLSNAADSSSISTLFQKNNNIVIVDEIYGQLKELIKSLLPFRKIDEQEYSSLIEKHLNGKSLVEYGVWVYYPWNNRLVHLLDEEEFIKLRTSRNQYKITTEEQELLRKKRIGIIGLSVGQSIALTLAMERTCGELRLADFDTAELSNLNRIRTGVQNLGLLKTIIAAREIAEIDPFLKVKIYSEGITNEHIDSFFLEDGKLDLLVEVCDGLDIKIKSRFKARALEIPVVMDTNDRGMLDVERFDLEPNRPILHGLAEGLDPENISTLTNEQKIPYILKMVGASTISTRLKSSMLEVEQTINSWPQLASSVVLGGAVTTDVCRRILLGQFHESGRYYIDLDEIVGNKLEETVQLTINNPYRSLTKEEMDQLAHLCLINCNCISSPIAETTIEKIIAAAKVAPSDGNCQPWKWLFKNNFLFLFHDQKSSWNQGNFDSIATHLSFGAALENLKLQAIALNLSANILIAPIEGNEKLIAIIGFEPSAIQNDLELKLATNIFSRHTNRGNGNEEPIAENTLNHILSFFKNKEEYFINHIVNKDKIDQLANLLANSERMKFLHQKMHQAYFNNLRWTEDDSLQTLDGIPVSSLGMNNGQLAALTMTKDWNVVATLAQNNLGNVFTNLFLKTYQSASCYILLGTNALNKNNIITAGIDMERAWIFANSIGIAFQPINTPIYLFNKIMSGNTEIINPNYIEDIKNLRSLLLNIFQLNKNESELILIKLAIAENTVQKSFRKNNQEIFYYK